MARWYVLPILFLGLVVLVTRLAGLEPWLLTRDPAAIHEANPFLGFASNVGILLWCAAASICLFAAARLRDRPRLRERRAFLLHAGLLTGWLMLDDLFMLHERLIPDDLGVPQPLLFAVYGAMLGWLLARHRRLIARSHAAPLGAALLCFAASMLLDQGPGQWHQWPWLVLVEDGCKFLGIALWLGYFAKESAGALDATRPEASASEVMVSRAPARALQGDAAPALRTPGSVRRRSA